MTDTRVSRVCNEVCEKQLVVVVERILYRSVVEHPLSKRKVVSSILPGGNVDTHKCESGRIDTTFVARESRDPVAYLRILRSALYRFRPSDRSIRAIVVSSIGLPHS